MLCRTRLVGPSFHLKKSEEVRLRSAVGVTRGTWQWTAVLGKQLIGCLTVRSTPALPAERTSAFHVSFVIGSSQPNVSGSSSVGSSGGGSSSLSLARSVRSTLDMRDLSSVHAVSTAAQFLALVVLPPVPLAFGVASEDVGRKVMRDVSSSPSVSAATCAHLVKRPWPISTPLT